jgi:hypothetical protein
MPTGKSIKNGALKLTKAVGPPLAAITQGQDPLKSLQEEVARLRQELEALRKEKEVTVVQKLGQGARDTLIKIVICWLFFMLFEQSTKNLGPEMAAQIQGYKEILCDLFEALFTPTFQHGGYATETVDIEGKIIVVPFATEAHRDLFHRLMNQLMNQRGGTRRRYRRRTQVHKLTRRAA